MLRPLVAQVFTSESRGCKTSESQFVKFSVSVIFEFWQSLSFFLFWKLNFAVQLFLLVIWCGADIAGSTFDLENTIIEYCRQINYKSVEFDMRHFDYCWSHGAFVAVEDLGHSSPLYKHLCTESSTISTFFQYSQMCFWPIQSLFPLRKIFTIPSFPNDVSICLSFFEGLFQVMGTLTGWHNWCTCIFPSYQEMIWCECRQNFWFVTYCCQGYCVESLL